MANAMITIHPYKDKGQWVFDDEAAGLKREPFVFGADVMLEQFVADIPSAKHGFKLIFSKEKFPGYQAELTWLREEYGGNWYRWEGRGHEGWLCPAMFKYFDNAPTNIFCKAEEQPPPLWR